MDKRLLFRGEIIGTKIWRYGPAKKTKGAGWICDNSANRWIEVVPGTIGQCTGLSAGASNRGETPEALLIFDGDILYIRNCILTVYWSFASLAWKVRQYADNTAFLQEFTHEEIKKAEIIGNRWDSSELAEEEFI